MSKRFNKIYRALEIILNVSFNLDAFKRYYKTYRNWPIVMIRVVLKKKGLLKIRDPKIILEGGAGLAATISFLLTCSNNTNITEVNLDLASQGIVKFNYHGTKVSLRVTDPTTMFANGDVSLFYNEDYKFLEPSGKTIVDIGASIGDSAIYFLFNGASRVVALEPFPYTYKMAVENVKLNGLGEKIILVNAGYGNGNTITINQEEISGTSSKLTNQIGNYNVNTYSLENLINRYNIPMNSAIKMDCEGCEYQVIKESNEILRHFERFQIEYHLGYKSLKRKLDDAGFLTEVKIDGSDPNVGWLYALRDENYPQVNRQLPGP